jgi:hypothetical protein
VGERDALSRFYHDRVVPQLSVELVYGGVVRFTGRSGQWLVGRCPLRSHVGDRRDPNFKVHSKDCTWKCWSQCSDKVKDAASFLERMHGYSFREAVFELARRVGADTRELTDERRTRSTPRWQPAQARAPHVEPPRLYAPAEELRRVWRSAVRVDEVPLVASFFRDRQIDPTMVADLNIARALRPGDLPGWASRHAHAQPWTREGYELITPLHDARGAMRSLKARNVRPKQEQPKNRDGSSCPKSIGPYRVRSLGEPPYTFKGLCFACPTWRHILQTGTLPPGWPSDRVPYFYFVEGEKKFALRASEESDATQDVPAVIGIVNGSWTDDLAARIPDGATIFTATDIDPAGERYATELIRSLSDRLRKGLISIELRDEYQLERDENGEPRVRLTPEARAIWASKQRAKRADEGAEP